MTKIRKHFKCPFSYAAHRRLSLCITYLNVYMLCVSPLEQVEGSEKDAGRRTRANNICMHRASHTHKHADVAFRASFKILLIFAYLFHFPPFFLCVLNVSQFPPFGHIVLSIHSTCSYHKKRHFESFVPKNPKRKIKENRGRGHGLCPFTSCILI